MAIFIIEHLEPELYEWCLIEYESISKIIGKDNLWFTNIKNKKDKLKLSKFGKVFAGRVIDMNLKKVCILDPFAEKTLSPKETSHFDYFIFGGILVNHTMNRRTERELARFIKNGEKRNIGREQFSTDNAVFVVSRIINGIPLENMQFQNEIEIKIDKIQSTILPYKYPLINGNPRISPKLINFIKKRDRII